MSDLSTTDTSLEQITTEIILLKQQTALNIIEIGRRLLAAKEQLPHGQWGNWLQESVEFSDRTARNFMRVAKEFSNRQTFADLPPSKVFALLDVPADDREQFVSAPHVVATGETKTVDEMSTRELQKVIKERNDLRDQLNSVKTEASDLRSAAQATNQELKKTQTTVKTLQDEIEAAHRRDITPTTVLVERIPEEVERELNELRAKAATEPVQTSETITRYRVHFEALVAGFKALLASLEDIRETDAEAYGQYRSAFLGLINRMQERI